MGRSISIVIPTYNRNDQLSEVLDYVLRSEVDGLSEVEVIVVDDGSALPAKAVVEAIPVESPFTLRCLSQKNAGPGEARNRFTLVRLGSVTLFCKEIYVMCVIGG
jgi:glycosyltransferase involved in cell wall biosynthesis